VKAFGMILPIFLSESIQFRKIFATVKTKYSDINDPIPHVYYPLFLIVLVILPIKLCGNSKRAGGSIVLLLFIFSIEFWEYSSGNLISLEEPNKEDLHNSDLKNEGGKRYMKHPFRFRYHCFRPN
jgi:hypothetical protein